MYGDKYPLSNCIPSTTSKVVSSACDSSIVITPSLPTLSIASDMNFPISSSAAEIAPTWAILSLESTVTLISRRRSTATLTALSIPFLIPIGLAPLVTFFNPSVIIACARIVAVVVPSPAISFVLFATSATNFAPIFSYGSSNSISLAIDTPSFVIKGEPNFLSKTTFLPLGPNVILTAFANLSTPTFIDWRASSENFNSLTIFPPNLQ